MSDIVTLAKKDGTRHENIQANVQSGRIFIADISVPVEERDRLVRSLPNGLEESFIVEDRGFQAQIGGIPAHFQIKVRREGTAPPTSDRNVYQAIGSNARMNIGSTDSSSNVVTISEENVFAELRNVLSSQVQNVTEKEQILAKIDEMENAKGSIGFVDKYQEFIALAANHMTVLTPFIPALTEFLKP